VSNANTSISWTDATWNCLRGCDIVSKGCTNCYAMKQAHRFSGPGCAYEGLTKLTRGGPVWTGKVALVPEGLDQPLRWRKPRRIFVNSMSDLFHEGVPFDFIAAVFGVMAATPRHTYQVLTKRPERMREFFRWAVHQDRGCEGTHGLLHCIACALSYEAGHHSRSTGGPLHTKHCASPDGPWPLPNVHLGVSVEDQVSADARIPLLLDTPAAVRFVSYEPALAAVDFTQIVGGVFPWHPPGPSVCCRLDALTGQEYHSAYGVWHGGHKAAPGLNWVIVGGESGPGARPCDVQWIRATVQQCREAGTRVWVKQLGSAWARDEVPDSKWLRGRIKVDRKGADPNEWPADLRVQEPAP
jgi:protein gp37